MHLGRFHAVIAELNQHFIEAALAGKLEQCASQLDSFASSKNQAHLDAFKEELSNLLKASEITRLDLLQPQAQQVIAELGLQKLMPPTIQTRVNEEIAEASFDPSGLGTRLRSLATEIADKAAQIKKIDSAFEDLHVEYQALPENRAEIGILLPREIVGDNLGELLAELAQINKLFRATNELVASAEYDPRVITISSSWWQIFLDLGVSQIPLWVIAIERIVALFKSNLEIKVLKRQIEENNLPAAISEQIQAEIDRRIERGLNDLAEELRAKFAQTNDQARLNEIETQMRHGLTHLARRLSQGAQVEINVELPDKIDGAQDPEGDERALSNDERARVVELAQLQARARMVSAATVLLDRSEPLLLPSDPE